MRPTMIQRLAMAISLAASLVLPATVLAHDADRGCTTVGLDGVRVQIGLLDRTVGATVLLGLRADTAKCFTNNVADTGFGRATHSRQPCTDSAAESRCT